MHHKSSWVYSSKGRGLSFWVTDLLEELLVPKTNRQHGGILRRVQAHVAECRVLCYRFLSKRKVLCHKVNEQSIVCPQCSDSWKAEGMYDDLEDSGRRTHLVDVYITKSTSLVEPNSLLSVSLELVQGISYEEEGQVQMDLI